MVALFPADVIDSFTDLVRVAGTSPATTAGCGSKRSNRFADTIAAPKRGEHRETWNGRQGRKREHRADGAMLFTIDAEGTRGQVHQARGRVANIAGPGNFS